jgi:hypothetical protein
MATFLLVGKQLLPQFNEVEKNNKSDTKFYNLA